MPVTVNKILQTSDSIFLILEEIIYPANGVEKRQKVQKFIFAV